jgi:hypothetical protein
MYDFDIELPKEVLTIEKHDKVNFDLLEGKIIIGLMGYAKSGKDFITKTFIEDYGYQRVAFADNIKREMNQYLKELVCKDINAHELEEVNKLTAQGDLVNWRPWTPDKIDFFTENLEMKKILRPYIIWYGEKVRTINGKFHWINKAFSEDAKDMDKIVLSDVRRLSELDLFKNSNEFKKRYRLSMAEAGITTPQELQLMDVNNYGTLLLEVNQFGLTDSDILTIETIQSAREQWLIDDAFYVDSRIPDEGKYRERSSSSQIKRIVKKFGIEKPAKSKNVQTTIFS